MFGSVFKMRPMAGKADEVRDVMRDNGRDPKGMVAAYFLKETAGGDLWGFAVFEDEKAYRTNADDPAQHANYERFRALLEADPEWHDGAIDAFRA